VERAESVVQGAVGGKDDEDEDEGRDDYGTETVLADGGTGGFVEDNEEKKKMAFVLPSPLPIRLTELTRAESYSMHSTKTKTPDTNRSGVRT